MVRPTRVEIDTTALMHNLKCIKKCAPGKKIIAMVKANAYGCGLSAVVPVLEGAIDAFGVASLEEAMMLRNLGSRSNCILFQGVFEQKELYLVEKERLQCVIHHMQQLDWLLATPLPSKIKIWVKVDTGMHRLGFPPSDVYDIIHRLSQCPWVDDEIGLLTHLACADEPNAIMTHQQLKTFDDIKLPDFSDSTPNKRLIRSAANSAAILSFTNAHADAVRPGIMLYGVSPFSEQTGQVLGLRPVMTFVSKISTIHHFPAHSPIGYGGSWQSGKPAIIGVVAAGYGDGYPRHIKPNTPTWIQGNIAPIVGRISMDMLTVDLTKIADKVKVGDEVELWGRHIPVEYIAQSADTIGYELLSQITPRARDHGSHFRTF